ncbi:MAG: hypothetical protein OXD29_15140 [Roseovarius sp.]|nr:hypothetical protein [Roseovarius sp.]
MPKTFVRGLLPGAGHSALKQAEPGRNMTANAFREHLSMPDMTRERFDRGHDPVTTRGTDLSDC